MPGRAGVLVLAAVAPVTMLVADPAGWYPFGPSKWLALSVLLLAGCALVLRSRAAAVERPLAFALVALVGWLAVAAAVGLDPLYAWVGTPERHFGVLTWALCALALVVGRSLDEREGDTILVGLVLAGVGVGAVATVEALGWEPDLLDVAGRLSGPFGSPAYLGAAAALLLPVAAGVAIDDACALRLRWAAGLAGATLTVACVGAGARAAWVGVAVSALVVAWGWRRELWSRARDRPKAATTVLLGLAVAVVAVVAVTPVGGRLSSLTDDDAPGGQGRIDEWRVATQVIRDHPLTGVGPEGYRIAFASGVDRDYERDHGRAQQPDRAHSGPLDLLLVGGVPALLAWLVVVGLVGRAAWALLRTGARRYAGVAAALVAHLAGQLLLFPVVELEPVVWLLAGLVVARAGIGRVPRPQRVPPQMVAGVLGIGAVLALGAGVTDVIADRRAETASDALARGDARAAAVSAESAVALRPDEVRLHLLAAQALVADQQGIVAGLRAVEDALDVSPDDPIVLLAKARLLVARAGATAVPVHVDAARAEIARQLEADPFDSALWRLAADAATVAGDDDGARSATARADDLTSPERARREAGR